MNSVLLQILVSLITGLTGFLLGRAENLMNIRRELQKERFEKLYNPFVKLYDITHMAAAYDFTDFSEDIQKQYIELLVNNMVYANSYTRKYIIQFMMIVSALKDTANDNQDKDELNRTFNTICELLFHEWNFLVRKLYYGLFDRIHNRLVAYDFKKKANQDADKNVYMNNL